MANLLEYLQKYDVSICKEKGTSFAIYLNVCVGMSVLKNEVHLYLGVLGYGSSLSH